MPQSIPFFAAHETSGTAIARQRARPHQLRAIGVLFVIAGFLSIPSVMAATPDITGMWIYRFADSSEALSADGLTPLGQRYVEGQKRALAADHVRNVANMKCLPTGFPALMTWRSPIQIMEGFGRLSITTEHDPGNDEPRTIYLAVPQAEDPDPSWNGHSVGYWEGNTLVVDTIRLNGRGRFHNFPVTTTMHAVERIRLENNGALLVDEITFEDPAIFVRPFKLTLRYDRMANATERMEAVCEPDLLALGEVDLEAIREFDSEAARMLDPDQQYNKSEAESLRASPLSR